MIRRARAVLTVLAVATLGSAGAVVGMAPGTAAAAHPTGGASYAGSTSQQGEPADLVVAANKRSIVRFQSQWIGPCQGTNGPPKYSDQILMTNVPISSAGPFSNVTTVTKDLGGGFTGQESVTLSGYFASPSKAAGTIDGQMTVHDASGASVGSCNSGLLRWTANDVLGFVGQSSQGQPVDVTFSAGVKKMTAFHIQWNANCQNGPPWKNASYFVDDRVTSGTFTDGITNQPVDISGGNTASQTAHLTGRFVSAKVVRGTYRLVMTVKNSSGSVVDTCTTGNLTWSARD